MDPVLKTDETLVRGCTSRVWLVANSEGGKFHFTAESDAKIVQGLIYLLDVAYQGKNLEDVRTLDIEKAFERLGLHQHLSPNRRNGFFAMVSRVRQLAA
jgi:cysteine desulfuration protein SufE